MKTPEPSKKDPSAANSAKFTGTENPRHLRAITALLRRPLPRKDLDSIAGCSNGPELVAAGFVHQTVHGQRPNKASWYAVTWRALDRHPGYDIGAAEAFQRGAYRKNAPLTPSPGAGPPLTAPSPGAMETIFTPASTPSPGDHLEKPSAGAKQRQHSTSKDATMNTQTITTTDHPEAIETLTDLWAKVGIRAVTLPKVGRAGTVLDDKTAARLSVARAAQAAAIARHTTKPAALMAESTHNEHSIDRTEAQDLRAWND